MGLTARWMRRRPPNQMRRERKSPGAIPGGEVGGTVQQVTRRISIGTSIRPGANARQRRARFAFPARLQHDPEITAFPPGCSASFGLNRRMNGDRSGDHMLELDQQRWLTYAEAGELLGISAQAARMLAKRRAWPRRTPNAYGDRALVLVPADALVQPRSASLGVHTGSVISGDQAGPNGHDHPNVQALDQAIAILRDQLGVANQRADDERHRADRAEARGESLGAELAEARITERIAVELAECAATEAADLRRRLDTEAEERRQVQARLDALLADQRPPPAPAAAPASPPRRWWWRRWSA